MKYRLSKVAMESIIETANLKANEYDLDDDTNRHIILHGEIKQPMNLTS